MNLAINARDAMPEGGVIRIVTEGVELDEAFCELHPGAEPGRYAKVAVVDTGAGMPSDVLNQVFEPFFTTKDTGEGTGLGLATAYGIVKQHSGFIYVDSEPGEGSVFRCYFPEAEGEDARALESGGPLPSLEGDETVLVVEDDPRVRRLAVSVLGRQGYRVLEAKDGLEALQVLEEVEEPVHLMLSDVVMPAMNGRELFETVSVRLPELKVLYMSGYPEDVMGREGALDDDVAFLRKPFTVQSLAEKIREVLDRG
jgi:CheY-like chemotaxis protein